MLRLTALVWSLNERYFNGHQLSSLIPTSIYIIQKLYSAICLYHIINIDFIILQFILSVIHFLISVQYHYVLIIIICIQNHY